MRRIAFGATLACVGVLVVRSLAPRVHARLSATCERMFEEMPDSFPPKRMLRGIEEISANSARTLELLEGERLGEGSSSDRRASPQTVERRRERELYRGIESEVGLWISHSPFRWLTRGECTATSDGGGCC